MSYKVRYRGLVEIECNTVEDVIAIAERLAGTEELDRNPEEKASTGQLDNLESTRFRELLSHLNETQRRLLQVLVEHPHGKTDRVLRQIFNLQDNKALGGVLAAVSKHAKRIGMGVDALFSKVDVGRDGERVLEFRPTEGLRKAAREMGWDIK